MRSHSFGQNWIAHGITYISIVGRISYLYFSGHIIYNQLELRRISLFQINLIDMQSLVIIIFVNNTNINIVCVVFDQIQISYHE